MARGERECANGPKHNAIGWHGAGDRHDGCKGRNSVRQAVVTPLSAIAGSKLITTYEDMTDSVVPKHGAVELRQERRSGRH
jgi:hypothetical protein